MTELEKKLEEDLIKALKEKNTDRLGTLRLIKNALKNEAKVKREELTNDEVIKILKKEAKKRKEASLAYEQGNRLELKNKEDLELNIILEYLPEELSDQELSKMIDEVLSKHDQVSRQDFGTIMKEVMAITNGQVDGSRVSGLVKEKLSS